MRVHYPRTPHLPWSPGATADDIRVADLSAFAGREIVVTEKLDGENTTLYPDGLHARSLDSAHHPSRAWVKALHGRIAARIPAGWRVSGENLFARHAIAYTDLDSYFYGFSVWDGERCLDWDATVRFTRNLGVPVPAVLWRGVFDERALRGLRLDPARQEGYVARPVAGFGRADFGTVVAKYVRRGHVQTDTHWMHAAVVPNGLGPRAALWDVRSGGVPDVAALSSLVDLPLVGPEDVATRLDLLGRGGDARLNGVLATMLRGQRRASLAGRLAGVLGMPAARRVADLVGLSPLLWRPYPDERRRGGLRSLATAADLGVLHAVAAAAAGRLSDQVDWSAMFAEDDVPFESLRTVLDLEPDAADRCWAEARAAFVAGRISTASEVAPSTWRWRSGDFPRLVVTVGPSGSGKSRFVAGLSDVDEVVSLDELRAARGSRADQRHNPEVLRAGLDRLDQALTGRRTVVWDATALNRQQRALVDGIAARRDALVTHAVLLVDPELAAKRNAGRQWAVPAEVLTNQFERFDPPYPGEAHRTWYVGASGTVEDDAGSYHSAEA
jgi:predicted kinase